MRNNVKTLPRVTGVIQGQQLQRLCHENAMRLQESLETCRSPEKRAVLCRALRDSVIAWDTARDAVRILRGKGLPTKVPEKLRKKALPPGSYKIIDIEEARPTVKALPETTSENAQDKIAPENSGVEKEGTPNTKKEGGLSIT